MPGQVGWQEVLIFAGVGLIYLALGVLLNKFVKVAWLGSALIILFGAAVCGGYFYVVDRGGLNP